MDTLESSFIQAIQEIEQNYRILPKQVKIRIEKWIEKLVHSGSNRVWRNERNSYAKLLLNMIIRRQLSEPFHILPPDGPLPSFPFHFKSITKDLAGGIQETQFWRNIYNQLQDTSDFQLYASLQSTSKPQSSSSHHPLKEHPPLSLNSDHQRYTRELQNLQLLITEQHEKIKLLEQQLYEERVKHEVEIHRLLFSHRQELQVVYNNNSGNRSTIFPPAPPSIPAIPFPAKEASGSGSGRYSPPSAIDRSQLQNHHLNHYNPQPNNNTSSLYNSTTNTPAYHQHHHRSYTNNNNNNNTNSSMLRSSQQQQQQEQNEEDEDQVNMMSATRPSATSVSMEYHRSSVDILPFPKFAGTTYPQQLTGEAGGEGKEDKVDDQNDDSNSNQYLSYLDNLQNEMKKMSLLASSTAASSSSTATTARF